MSAILTDISQSASFCCRVLCAAGALQSRPSRQCVFTQSSARANSSGS